MTPWFWKCGQWCQRRELCIKKVLAVQDPSEMLNLNWGSINFWVFELFTTWFDEFRIPKTIFLKKSDCFHEKKTTITGKSLSEALILASTNPQYDKRLFIELRVQHMKITSSEHVV